MMLAHGTDTMTTFHLAFRHLSRHRGFTTIAGLTLALGIGFVTVLFTIVNAVALRDLPVENASQVVSAGIDTSRVDDVARQQTSLEGLAAAAWAPRHVTVGERRTIRSGATISPNAFDLLRVRPIVGRALRVADALPGAPAVVVIGYGVWGEQFAGAADVVGRDIVIDGMVCQVVGVMPVGFGFPRNEELWQPLEAGAAARAEGRQAGTVVFGRLRHGVTAAEASAELTAIEARHRAVSSPGDPIVPVEVATYSRRTVKGAVMSILLLLLVATVLVLVLACANVTTLLLGQASRRGRELAVQASLGASRARLMSQMLVESLMLAILGACGGLLVAQWGVDWIAAVIATESALTGGPPYWVSFDLDLRVLGVAVGTTLVAAVLAGIAPALQASRIDFNEVLKGTSDRPGFRIGGFTRAVVHVQMAISVTLVVAAGLFLMAVSTILQTRLPYDPSSILTARLSLIEREYADPGSRARFFTTLSDRLRAHPQVSAVSLTSAESLRQGRRRVALEGRSYSRELDRPEVLFETVAPEYFNVFGAALLEGRDFGALDVPESSPVAIVNRAFASRLWPNEPAIGRRFRTGDGQPWLTVIGVAPDLGTLRAAESQHAPAYYQAASQQPQQAMTVLLRGSTDASALSEILWRDVAALNPHLVPAQVHTALQIRDMERVGILLPAGLFIVCGLAALSLASIGVYGVVSFSVIQRAREIGIRLALGARRGVVVRMLVGQGLRSVAAGLGIGVVLALGASLVLRSVIANFGGSAFDMWIYGGVVALLGAVGLVALLVPALRGSRVNPLDALRVE